MTSASTAPHLGGVRDLTHPGEDDIVADQHDTAWKVFAGWRPVSFVKAELEYISSVIPMRT